MLLLAFVRKVRGFLRNAREIIGFVDEVFDDATSCLVLRQRATGARQVWVLQRLHSTDAAVGTPVSESERLHVANRRLD